MLPIAIHRVVQFLSVEFVFSVWRRTQIPTGKETAVIAEPELDMPRDLAHGQLKPHARRLFGTVISIARTDGRCRPPRRSIDRDFQEYTAPLD